MTDDLRKLADAGVEVIGSDDWVLEPAFRPGNWLSSGGIVAVIAIALLHIGLWWPLAVVVALGTVANEWERRQIKARLKARRSSP